VRAWEKGDEILRERAERRAAEDAERRAELQARGIDLDPTGHDEPGDEEHADDHEHADDADAHDADDRPVAWSRVRVRVLVVARMLEVAMPMAAGCGRVELDPLRLERLEVLGVGCLTTLGEQLVAPVPGPHRAAVGPGACPRATREPRARYASIRRV